MIAGLQEFIQERQIERRIVDGQECLVMYKAVRKDFGSWFHRGSDMDKGAYYPGTIVRVRKWDTDRMRDCAPGLHAASLQCAKSFRRAMTVSEGMRLVEVLVRCRDVVCVPRLNGGMLRCKRLTVLRTITRSMGI